MNFNLRAPWHDYRSKSIYHLTLCKAQSIPDFGRIAGNCDIPVGQPEALSSRPPRPAWR